MYICRSEWPQILRRRSAAARLLRLWVRIPPGTWMSVVSVVCCQVEVSAMSWSLVQRSPTDCGTSLCDLETSWMKRSWPTGGCRAKKNKTKQSPTFKLFHYKKRLPALLKFITNYHSLGGLWYGPWGWVYYLIHGDIQLWGPSGNEVEMLTTKTVF
jgi:hypothetical protein